MNDFVQIHSGIQQPFPESGLMSAQLPQRVLVVGLGKTGLSAVRYLLDKGCDVSVVDSRQNPPGLEEHKQSFPGVLVRTGELSSEAFLNVDMMVVSPGIPVATPVIIEAASHGVELVGDVELFLRENTAPVIAITGSNGKSTVTELVTAMLNDAGIKAVAAGNIGLPVLDLLKKHKYEVAVLELSSFQLETTRSLSSASAVVLNVSEDHMDRYDSLNTYVAAKSVVYQHGRRMVLNRDDALVRHMLVDQSAEVSSFGLSEPRDDTEFGVLQVDGEQWLAKGQHRIVSTDSLAMPGSHNIANVLASMALVEPLGVSLESAAKTAQTFSGLAHRCKPVQVPGEILWINDSKATNVGATLAALQGMGRPVILIAGGEGKDADFAPLRPVVERHVKSVILLGKDKQKIADALKDCALVSLVDDMAQAVSLARHQAESGDIVMLSPACASLDMYANFAARGDHFESLVRGGQS